MVVKRSYNKYLLWGILIKSLIRCRVLVSGLIGFMGAELSHRISQHNDTLKHPKVHKRMIHEGRLSGVIRYVVSIDREIHMKLNLILAFLGKISMDEWCL